MRSTWVKTDRRFHPINKIPLQLKIIVKQRKRNEITTSAAANFGVCFFLSLLSSFLFFFFDSFRRTKAARSRHWIAFLVCEVLNISITYNRISFCARMQKRKRIIFSKSLDVIKQRQTLFALIYSHYFGCCCCCCCRCLRWYIYSAELLKWKER